VHPHWQKRLNGDPHNKRCLVAEVTQDGSRLGVGAAVHGQIGAGDVRGLWAGDERHQRRDLVHTPEPAERGVGLLRCGPIARRGI
jgi:hypothetical protein